MSLSRANCAVPPPVFGGGPYVQPSFGVPHAGAIPQHLAYQQQALVQQRFLQPQLIHPQLAQQHLVNPQLHAQQQFLVQQQLLAQQHVVHPQLVAQQQLIAQQQLLAQQQYAHPQLLAQQQVLAQQQLLQQRFVPQYGAHLVQPGMQLLHQQQLAHPQVAATHVATQIHALNQQLIALQQQHALLLGAHGGAVPQAYVNAHAGAAGVGRHCAMPTCTHGAQHAAVAGCQMGARPSVDTFPHESRLDRHLPYRDIPSVPLYDAPGRNRPSDRTVPLPPDLRSRRSAPPRSVDAGRLRGDLTVKGQRMSAEQRRILETVVRVGEEMGANRKVLESAVAAVIQESTARNGAVVDSVDRDSLGIFQQRPSKGWGTREQIADPEYAAEQFFRKAIAIDRRQPNLTKTQLAQAVQRSAHPDEYARWSVEAERIVANVLGTGSSRPTTLTARNGAAGSTRTAVKGDVDGLDHDLLLRLDALGRELGTPINIVSGSRTRAEQARLYEKYRNGTGNPANRPGTSKHEHGAAADAYVDGVALAKVPGAREAANRHGLHFPVKGEAWHVEATNA